MTLESKQTASKSLVSIAMLKVKYDVERQDYLDYLLPFVAHVMPSRGGRAQAQVIADDVRKEFGLDVPLAVIERLLQRLQRRGALSKVDGSLYVDKDLRDATLGVRREAARRDLQRVIAAFQENSSIEWKKVLDEQEATVAIVGFVRHFAVDCLKSFVFRTPIPAVPSTRQSDVLVASFLRRIQESDAEMWALILLLFESVMLANAFTCPDADMPTANFAEVAFYFDTPLLLSAVGLQGAYDQRKANELCDMVRRLKGVVYAFEHSVDEAKRILHYAETKLFDLSATNRSIRYFRESKKSPSDVALAAATFENLLKGVGIRIRPNPPYDEKFQIDETQLEGCLDEDLQYANPRAALDDINSVRSVYVLRKGSAPRRLEQSKAVFVTGNQRLAHAVYQYSKQFEIAKEVSPAITDFALANLCWLKQPAAAERLAELELLASSVAALRPSGEQWAACLNELEKLKQEGRITPDQEDIVRASITAQDDLVGLTIGSDAELGPAVALELVKRAEARIAAKHQAEAESARRVTADAQRELELERNARRMEEHSRAKKRSEVAGHLARAFEYTTLGVVGVGSFYVAYAAFGGTALVAGGLVAASLAIGASLALAAMTWFGWSRMHLRSVVQARVEGWLSRVLGD